MGRAVDERGSVGYEDRYRQAAGRVFGRLRAERGWSLRDFAERAGTAHTSLYAVERGEATPGIDVLGRVAAAAGLDLTGILLLIVEELDPEPGGLGETLKALQSLSPAQQREVQRFIEFLQYRDRQG